MNREEQFPCRYVTFDNTPYLPATYTRHPQCGGVLPRGEEVWAKPLGTNRPVSMQVFVKQLGVVDLDPRWLVPADLLGNGGPA